MELLKIKMLQILVLVGNKISKKKKVVFQVLRIMDYSQNLKNKILLQKILINLEDSEEIIIV
jgi:hypothetical protein